jgi:glycosyltransferase involved in cell wall biosynthesis
MSQPLVTIGLPTFNAKDTVAAALRSALEQTWRPVEVIVVDDASSDETLSVVRDVAGGGSNLEILINSTNSGVAVGRNRIIERARGDFIIFFDDDDVSVPERIEVQFKRIVDYERGFAGGAPVVCHAAREQIYPDGTRRIEQTMGIAESRPAPAGLPVAYRVLTGAPLEDGYGSCASCAQMARTRTFRAVGGYDPAFRRCDDTEFLIRVARAGGHFAGVGTPLVVQTMTKTADKTLERETYDMLSLMEKHRDLFESESLYCFCREWIELKHRWLRNDRAGMAIQLVRLGATHPLLALRRALLAMRNVDGNRAFARLHSQQSGN